MAGKMNKLQQVFMVLKRVKWFLWKIRRLVVLLFFITVISYNNAVGPRHNGDVSATDGAAPSRQVSGSSAYLRSSNAPISQMDNGLSNANCFINWYLRFCWHYELPGRRTRNVALHNMQIALQHVLQLSLNFLSAWNTNILPNPVPSQPVHEYRENGLPVEEINNGNTDDLSRQQTCASHVACVLNSDDGRSVMPFNNSPALETRQRPAIEQGRTEQSADQDGSVNQARINSNVQIVPLRCASRLLNPDDGRSEEQFDNSPALETRQRLAIEQGRTDQRAEQDGSVNQARINYNIQIVPLRCASRLLNPDDGRSEEQFDNSMDEGGDSVETAQVSCSQSNSSPSNCSHDLYSFSSDYSLVSIPPPNPPPDDAPPELLMLEQDAVRYLENLAPTQSSNFVSMSWHASDHMSILMDHLSMPRNIINRLKALYGWNSVNLDDLRTLLQIHDHNTHAERLGQHINKLYNGIFPAQPRSVEAYFISPFSFSSRQVPRLQNPYQVAAVLKNPGYCRMKSNGSMLSQSFVEWKVEESGHPEEGKKAEHQEDDGVTSTCAPEKDDPDEEVHLVHHDESQTDVKQIMGMGATQATDHTMELPARDSINGWQVVDSQDSDIEQDVCVDNWDLSPLRVLHPAENKQPDSLETHQSLDSSIQPSDQCLHMDNQMLPSAHLTCTGNGPSQRPERYCRDIQVPDNIALPQNQHTRADPQDWSQLGHHQHCPARHNGDQLPGRIFCQACSTEYGKGYSLKDRFLFGSTEARCLLDASIKPEAPQYSEGEQQFINAVDLFTPEGDRAAAVPDPAEFPIQASAENVSADINGDGENFHDLHPTWQDWQAVICGIPPEPLADIHLLRPGIPPGADTDDADTEEEEGSNSETNDH